MPQNCADKFPEHATVKEHHENQMKDHDVTDFKKIVSKIWLFLSRKHLIEAIPANILIQRPELLWKLLQEVDGIGKRGIFLKEG